MGIKNKSAEEVEDKLGKNWAKTEQTNRADRNR